MCSNSFRGDKLDNAVGLLKEEMRRLGSLVMRAADDNRVPAGAALAVDRERFSEAVTRAIHSHPLISVVREELTSIPTDPAMFPLIVATGPLTSPALSTNIAALVGDEHLYFYDAISPIVLAESIDRSKVFRASRWDRSLAPLPPAAACGIDDGQGDYLNCPLTRDEYERFYDAVVHAESATVHDFDKEKFFEGCLPIEVMAHRGRDTLRFGPMKPVGLIDPRTGRTPYAVVQLRQDNLAGDHYSLVGFQTQLKWGEQARVLRMIPGLEQAEFVRFGMIHRNTYINGPTVLRPTWQTRMRDDLFFAGQISGVEGYVADIGWRSTRIRMLRNNLVLVPNSKLSQAIVTNFYLPDRELQVRVDVGVDYGSDLAHVERVTCEVAKETLQTVPGRIVVTGIGKGITRAFAEEGWAVVIAARNADRLKATAEELGKIGPPIVPIQADVTDESQVKALFKQTMDRFRRLDILVNNSGIAGPVKHVEDISFKMSRPRQIIITASKGSQLASSARSRGARFPFRPTVNRSSPSQRAIRRSSSPRTRIMRTMAPFERS